MQKKLRKISVVMYFVSHSTKWMWHSRIEIHLPGNPRLSPKF